MYSSLTFPRGWEALNARWAWFTAKGLLVENCRNVCKVIYQTWQSTDWLLWLFLFHTFSNRLGSVREALFFFFLHNLTWDIGKSGPACLLFFFVQKQTIYICRDTKHHNPFFYESKLKWTVSESFPDSPCQCWKLTLAIRLSWEQCQTFVEENLKNTSIVPSLGG